MVLRRKTRRSSFRAWVSGFVGFRACFFVELGLAFGKLEKQHVGTPVEVHSSLHGTPRVIDLTPQLSKNLYTKKSLTPASSETF